MHAGQGAFWVRRFIDCLVGDPYILLSAWYRHHWTAWGLIIKLTTSQDSSQTLPPHPD